MLLAALTLALAPSGLWPAAAAAKRRARTAVAACSGSTLSPTAADLALVDRATLCLVNQIRASDGLRPLRANRYLQRVASSQVRTMVSWDYFGDVRPSGQTPMSLVGVTRYPAHAAGFAVGENIAWGTGALATPAHIVAEWMASPPHREVILTAEYRDAGIAATPAVPSVLHPNRPGATYAMEFGARKF